jgi:hypothetical protein
MGRRKPACVHPKSARRPHERMPAMVCTQCKAVLALPIRDRAPLRVIAHAHTCRPCGRCDALVDALARERAIHGAERTVTRVLRKLPPERRGPVLRAAMLLLGMD